MIPSTGVILPSAGKGRRMGGQTAKQFMEVSGEPVLFHTLRRIMMLEPVDHIVIPASDNLYEATRNVAGRCLEQCQKADSIVLSVIRGGTERMHSVHNGLKELLDTPVELILVHDAVRPCFPLDSSLEAMQVAIQKGGAILALPCRDTVKMVSSGRKIVSTVDREKLWLAQTPQVFRKEMLKVSYDVALQKGYSATDEASLAENAGFAVHVVEGSFDNIKITYPADLQIVEKWFQEKENL